MVVKIITNLTKDLTRTVRLYVSGMSCGACAIHLENKLNKIDNICASVNFMTRIATIKIYSKVEIEKLCVLVEKFGYKAVLNNSSYIIPDNLNSENYQNLLWRLIVSAVVFIPLTDLSVMFAAFPSTRFFGWQWTLIVLASPVVTWAAWPFHIKALKNITHKNAGMETLISVGVFVSTLWSVYSTFIYHETCKILNLWQILQCSNTFYFEISVGVTVFFLAGHYTESRACSHTKESVYNLTKLKDKSVSILMNDGSEIVLPVAKLKKDQYFIVRPGETIVADGFVIAGSSLICISAVTGESKPIYVNRHSKVISGTLVLDGCLIIQTYTVGSDTSLHQIIKTIEQTQTNKLKIQVFVDRVAATFVPLILTISIVTAFAWILVNNDLSSAISSALSVLVISCPCALSLATPAAITVALGRGAQLGIFFKKNHMLESVYSINTVVFDKTGTLTTGKLSIESIIIENEYKIEEVLLYAASIESISTHPIAHAITTINKYKDLYLVKEFQIFAGCGVTGIVNGHRISVGNPKWIEKNHSISTKILNAYKKSELKNHTVVFIAFKEIVCGIICFSDVKKKSATSTISCLNSFGIQTILLTGDNSATALDIGKSVGIKCNNIISDALPIQKAHIINKLQKQGKIVAMIGDGINDGPALSCSDVSFGIGDSTDLVLNIADIILVSDDLSVIPQALGLIRKTAKVIRSNVVWAMVYNLAAVPMAAMDLLNPLVSGAAMAISSLIVISNSLRLNSYNTFFNTNNYGL